MFGLITALAGFQHGVGNALQGNVPPDGIVIESWPDAPAYEILSGEPAMSVIPNLLLSGIVTMIVAVVIAVWSIANLRSPRRGLELIGLSFLFLLVGGGFGPPLVGFIGGGAATRIDSRVQWLEAYNSGQGDPGKDRWSRISRSRNGQIECPGGFTLPNR